MTWNSFFKAYFLPALLVSLSNACYAEQTVFKLNSDSSTHDLAKNILIYSGNAIFTTGSTTVKGDEIKAFKSQSETKKIQVSGSYAELTQFQPQLKRLTQLSAGTINYELDSKIINAESDINLIQKSADSASDQKFSKSQLENTNATYFQVKGQKLSLLPAPHNRLKMTGTPLKITISQPDQEPLLAEAAEMFFNQQTQEFELSGKVVLSTGRETIRADKIIYNNKTRFLQIPESKGNQVEMVQTRKSSHE